ncbi:GPI ethanolamine phosphate transferase 3-like isoform X1 [Phoenix dactylifera]|uniref:GPI ethanolamine phosphate transferase 3-like isoform X1 n=2 Tax=Phoenix dactylifera TaxID=42345 RepID=A0A8B9A0B5_PHODC|nr:GPI ethanolamine phosphate transferase 3-like isoform X1 [Phoenix dactylifera]XP_038977253.1 GPI ethanolamine phosphate transferase 3-like isoform X1 [Phoenix dactylifera]
MGSKWALIRPFFLILLLHSVAIYLFTRGFLLTRTELSAYSRCSDLSHSPCSALHNSSSHDDRRCWTKPAVDRLVIIILDALRFDFLAPSSFFAEAKPWMDKLRVLQKLASGEGSSARIFKAIADPPTTSMQRLKGLTTGGLPTFIDVGNSFGAPAIVEDNLICQLNKNGKRVLMMGDDTWLQLFPDHFNKSYPYPSFDVKDLDTVDNGVMEHLLPSLYKDDWDVLIAHFLGVDHAGHIFGVDSTPMIQKLEQYNSILEKVVDVLKSQSGPGGPHENTFLVVMGDHGQTLNGDHGGGTPEEVETSLFAMSLRSPPASISSILELNSCKLDLDGEKICIGTIQQLDFAATVAALLGIPTPFGSIGHVNPELYALSASTWDGQKMGTNNCKSWSNLEAWMQNYANTLCINCWQVKRYIDLYSATSVIGLPSEDLHHVAELYAQAQTSSSNTKKSTCLSENGISNETQDSSASVLQLQIDAYSNFLENVAKLARSAWTEFDLILMAIGICFMLVSLSIHLFAIGRVNIVCGSFYAVSGICAYPFSLFTAFLLVVIRAASFLSNSYILMEGRVANFLLATTGILNLRYSVRNGKFSKDEFVFLLINIIIRFGIGFGMSKQTVGSTSLNAQYLNILGIYEGHPLWMMLLEILPVIMLSLLAIFLYKCTLGISCWGYLKYLLIMGSSFSYMLISVHWVSESKLIAMSTVIQDIGRNLAPRIVFAVGLGLLVSSLLSRILGLKDRDLNPIASLTISTVSMLSSWSPTILILLGRQGPFVGLICIIGAWCIVRAEKEQQIKSKSGTLGGFAISPVHVTQWNLLAVCLFFYTGHWCTFDGLRYSAAFIGFDHFNIIRQGILLAIDTFGVSHIVPILSLPFLVMLHPQNSEENKAKGIIFVKLTQVFLIYGLITSVTTMFAIICVTIHRRHLMVWGLFAPKYVFEAMGLLLTDVVICLASLYYY